MEEMLLMVFFNSVDPSASLMLEVVQLSLFQGRGGQLNCFWLIGKERMGDLGEVGFVTPQLRRLLRQVASLLHLKRLEVANGLLLSLVVVVKLQSVPLLRQEVLALTQIIGLPGCMRLTKAHP